MKTFVPALSLALVTLFTCASADLQAQSTDNQNNSGVLSSGKLSSASSTEDMDHGAASAFDGNQNTFFLAGSADNEWLMVDLGRNYLVENLYLTWGKGYAKEFAILFSADGSFKDNISDSIYIKDHQLKGTGSVAGVDTIITKSNTIARFVKFQGVKKGGSGSYKIYEMLVIGSSSNANLFPVSLVNFGGSAETSQATLRWNMVTEYGNAGFTVERSADGSSFAAVGFVAAKNAGTYATSYSFTDNQPLNGRNYYRLKQTRVDGKYAYTAVIQVQVIVASNLTIYPIPARSQITVAYNAAAGEKVHIVIFGSDGMPVYTRDITFQAGQQSIQVKRTSAMLPGKYFMSIRSSKDNNTITRQILLQ